MRYPTSRRDIPTFRRAERFLPITAFSKGAFISGSFQVSVSLVSTFIIPLCHDKSTQDSGFFLRFFFRSILGSFQQFPENRDSGQSFGQTPSAIEPVESICFISRYPELKRDRPIFLISFGASHKIFPFLLIMA